MHDPCFSFKLANEAQPFSCPHTPPGGSCGYRTGLHSQLALCPLSRCCALFRCLATEPSRSVVGEETVLGHQQIEDLLKKEHYDKTGKYNIRELCQGDTRPCIVYVTIWSATNKCCTQYIYDYNIIADALSVLCLRKIFMSTENNQFATIILQL